MTKYLLSVIATPYYFASPENHMLQESALNLVGLGSTSETIIHSGLAGIQSIAGLVTFVLFCPWMARHHLKQLWHHALGKSNDIEDAHELFSYRTAVFGYLTGMVFIVSWLYATGLSIPIMSIFIVLLFIFYLALARVVAETGLVSLDLPIKGSQAEPGDLVFLLAGAFDRHGRGYGLVSESTPSLGALLGLPTSLSGPSNIF